MNDVDEVKNCVNKVENIYHYEYQIRDEMKISFFFDLEKYVKKILSANFRENFYESLDNVLKSPLSHSLDVYE